jgi:hypothetical protein
LILRLAALLFINFVPLIFYLDAFLLIAWTVRIDALFFLHIVDLSFSTCGKIMLQHIPSGLRLDKTVCLCFGALASTGTAPSWGACHPTLIVTCPTSSQLSRVSSSSILSHLLPLSQTDCKNENDESFLIVSASSGITKQLHTI